MFYLEKITKSKMKFAENFVLGKKFATEVKNENEVLY